MLSGGNVRTEPSLVSVFGRLSDRELYDRIARLEERNRELEAFRCRVLALVALHSIRLAQTATPGRDPGRLK